MIVYIAGKMTGLPDYGRAKFMAAQRALERAGHIVLNPAALPVGLPDKRYMPITLAMLEAAEAIYLLNGWASSRGATAEFYYARRQSKIIFREGVMEERCALGVERDSEHAADVKRNCHNCDYGIWENYSCRNRNSPYFGMVTWDHHDEPCKCWERDIWDDLYDEDDGGEGE